ncbi:methyl-accepting chemotaxis protein [Halogeometricum sp. S1BR25-6]|uniref:Methyl-accepting chemotaxis protein n=1 Tax=Halogeometricum salsisoli TaxID=2950536 RepID=A0ABU2G8P2_9EURY|nr:methyl-accepting chemotaxis protein [Halogeometricum sp. S1BR25-6]MDS0297149.1 methyl-accepting chemotaxis protein [Halogeometricum sp. S1BR25-6]
MVEFTAVFDVVGTVAYLGAAVVAFRTYRRADAEAGFWLNFGLAALLGFFWAGVVSAEHLGIGGEVFDIISVSLLTATIAVFAVGATGTYAVVEDMKCSRASEAESRAAAESLTESLESGAVEFDRVMDAAAAGDLTVRMSRDGESDAMARVAESFNGMMADLETTVVNIQSFAGDVADSTAQIDASADEIRMASEEVSTSMTAVAGETDEQHRHLSAAADEMSTLSATVEEVAASTTQVAETSNEASELGENGRASATEALKEMDHVRETTDRTVGEVEALRDELDEIVAIVDLITEIADRTNLLALNASIEAARAGEAGKGFAVVAAEIKELASESTTATGRIETLVTDIQSSAAGTAGDMREVGDRVASGTETVGSALAALEDIATRVEELNGGIQEIDRATTEQATSTEDALLKVEDARQAGERTSEEVSSVTAASEEQTASVSEVATSIGDLSTAATALRDRLARFEVGDSAGVGAATDPSSPAPNAVSRPATAGSAARMSTDGGRSDPLGWRPGFDR